MRFPTGGRPKPSFRRRLLYLLTAHLLALPGPICAVGPAVAGDADPIKSALRHSVERKLVAGAVAMVVDRDSVLAQEAVGYSSLAAKEPMRADGLFWIASMTKSLTGTALMMLVDEGRISLDDPVEKYLPEFRGQQVAGVDGVPPHAPKHPVTIREVMNHTAGLVSAGDPALRNLYTLEARVGRCGQMPLVREPGTKFEYNNSGINTGGRIIEVVSGVPYAEFMQKRLFDPLEMTDTTFWPNEEQAARLVRTVRRAADGVGLEEIQQDKGLTPALVQKLGGGVKVPVRVLADMGGGQLPVYAHRFADPAGGLYSTAGDVARFCQMLLAGGVYKGKRLLSEKSIREMSRDQTGTVPVNPQEAYGVGWFIKKRADEGPSVGSYGHRGARRTAMWIDPTNGISMILLVERFDMTGDEQKEMYGSFMKAAVAAYGKAKKK